MRVLALAVVLSLSWTLSPVAASVFKCAADKGAVVYQDVPCSAGRELRNFDIDPPALTVLPATPGATAPRTTNEASERGAKTARNGAREQADERRAAERKFARSGMSEAEVVQRLGRPDVTSGGGRKSGRRWAYLPRPGDPNTMTTLTLQGGNVVDVERKLVR
ncbi:MAG TPA: DUF4124 domain-containing protein [Casimicrobiaceae bacterium]|jgi:hypothetical protein